jgi:hypothetical protein
MYHAHAVQVVGATHYAWEIYGSEVVTKGLAYYVEKNPGLNIVGPLSPYQLSSAPAKCSQLAPIFLVAGPDGGSAKIQCAGVGWSPISKHGSGTTVPSDAGVTALPLEGGTYPASSLRGIKGMVKSSVWNIPDARVLTTCKVPVGTACP